MDNITQAAPYDLDYNVIRDDLMSVLLATTNKIEREWPPRYNRVDSAREIVLVTVRLAINTFGTIAYLCADTPDDFRRDRIFCLSVPPLSRTILESVLTIMFLLEDLPSRSEWFWKTGHREMSEALKRYEKHYGNNPQWRRVIARLGGYVRNPPPFLRLTNQEVADPSKKIPRWPNPGRMAGYKKNNQSPTESIFWMAYLNDWYYGSLSGQTHLSAHGLLARGHFLSPMETLVRLHGDRAEETVRQDLKRFRDDQIFTAIIMILALVSEIELHFQFGLNERLKYLWVLIAGSSDYAKDVYDRRYSRL
ncbi:MAG: hypothetical protein AABN34_15505 [Acidobacteriota bacterium]